MTEVAVDYLEVLTAVILVGAAVSAAASIVWGSPGRSLTPHRLSGELVPDDRPHQLVFADGDLEMLVIRILDQRLDQDGVPAADRIRADQRL